MKKIYSLALVLALLLTACAPAGSAPTSTGPDSSPAPTQSPPTQSPPPGPLVYTDASQLTPYEKPERAQAKFTRRYAAFTDTLIPADDYGPLLSFPGVNAARSDSGGWFWGDYQLYGLVTLDGEVVVDPVFSSASRPRRWDELAQTSVELDCLVLQKVVLDETGQPQSVAAVCATDGSWCTGFDYSYDWELLMDGGDGGLLPLRKGGNAIVFLDPHTGAELNVIDLSPILERWPDLFGSLCYYLRYDTRYIVFSDAANHYLFDVGSGEITCLEELLGCKITNPAMAVYSGLPCPVRVSAGWGYIDSGGWVIEPAYESASEFQGDYAVIWDKTAYGASSIIDRRGQVVGTLPLKIANLFCVDGEISYLISDGAITRRYVLDNDLNPVEVETSTDLPIPADFTAPRTEGDWLVQELPDPSPTVPGGWAFWNTKTGVRWDFPGEELGYVYQFSGDHATFQGLDNARNFTLLDLSTGETTPLGRWAAVSFEKNMLTGEPYLYLDGMDGAPSELRTLQGDTLYVTDIIRSWALSLWGERVFYAGGDSAVTITDLKSGELIFSWPLAPSMDD